MKEEYVVIPESQERYVVRVFAIHDEGSIPDTVEKFKSEKTEDGSPCFWVITQSFVGWLTTPNEIPYTEQIPIPSQ